MMTLMMISLRMKGQRQRQINDPVDYAVRLKRNVFYPNSKARKRLF